MTRFLPDVNVWVALSVSDAPNSESAWAWLMSLPATARLLFCRPSQAGLLRVLTGEAAMGARVLRLREALDVYDRWVEDARVEFAQEPAGCDEAFRDALAFNSHQPASRWISDAYLAAFARSAGATLVTFDKVLLRFATQRGWPAVQP